MACYRHASDDTMLEMSCIAALDVDKEMLLQAREAMLRDVMAIASKPSPQTAAPAPKKAKTASLGKSSTGELTFLPLRHHSGYCSLV